LAEVVEEEVEVEEMEEMEEMKGKCEA